jgi:hypothetical protein
MAGCLRRAEGPDPSQYRRALQRALCEQQSNRRLAAAFAEEDAEIAARLGDEIVVEPTYRFTCRFCSNKFSLEVLRDNHEKECGRVAPEIETLKEERVMPGNGRRPINCKHCGHTSPGLTEHNIHLLEVHRAATLAARREKFEERRAEDSRIDRGIMAREEGRSSGALSEAPRAEPVHGPGNGHCCPTCGGTLPVVTAQLVAALQAEGIAEVQAFAAARIARRILGAGAAA